MALLMKTFENNICKFVCTHVEVVPAGMVLTYHMLWFASPESYSMNLIDSLFVHRDNMWL